MSQEADKIKDAGGPLREVDKTVFHRQRCTDCGRDSGMVKWYTQKVLGTQHTFVQAPDEVYNRDSCPECTRAGAITRANEEIKIRTQKLLDDELARLKARDSASEVKVPGEIKIDPSAPIGPVSGKRKRSGDDDGAGGMDSEKELKASPVSNETVLSPDDPLVLKHCKPLPKVPVQVYDIQNMYWDQEKCTLVQKRPIAPEPGMKLPEISYEFIPISRIDPADLKLNDGTRDKSMN